MAPKNACNADPGGEPSIERWLSLTSHGSTWLSSIRYEGVATADAVVAAVAPAAGYNTLFGLHAISSGSELR